MGIAKETIVGTLTATANATAQAFTVVPPQSFTVRSVNPNTVARLQSLWGNTADIGNLRIRSPRLHDDVVGIEVGSQVNKTSPLLAGGFEQVLYPQDILTVEDYFATAPTANDIQQIGFQVHYDDLPGSAANLQPWAQVKPQVQQYLGILVNPASAASAGAWGAGVAINATQDVMKANSWYAILGYAVQSNFTAWSMVGSDIANLYYGGPGAVDSLVTRDYFIRLEEQTGLPSIPVINSANKQGTLIQVVDKVASTTYPITLFTAYLGPVGG